MNNDIRGLFGMSDDTYNRLKFLAQYVLPALGALYFALAGIWDFPYGEQVIGTLAAIDVFLGLMLGYSNKVYNERTEALPQPASGGQLIIDETDPMKDVFRLEPNMPFQELKNASEITFKVVNESQK